MSSDRSSSSSSTECPRQALLPRTIDRPRASIWNQKPSPCNCNTSSSSSSIISESRQHRPRLFVCSPLESGERPDPPISSGNALARAKAFDLQAGSADAEGREGLASSLHRQAEKTKEQGLRSGDNDDEEEEEEEEESAVSTAYLVSYFVAGGAAGAASRTVVSPLERLKILMQVQPSATKGTKGAYGGVVSGLVKMWKEEGFAGYMRGNGINCLRIIPYSAVQFSTYEIVKEKLKRQQGGGELDTSKRLLAGAAGGIASCVATFPMDLVRARISIASASLYADAQEAAAAAATTSKDGKTSGSTATAKAEPPPPKLTRSEMRKLIAERQKRVPGIVAMTKKVYIEEGGIRGLYRGCVPTAAGVAPYVAINFAAYESLRSRFLESHWNEEGQVSTLAKLCCGAIAGSVSQTLVYPLDVLRRRMQVAGMKNSKLGYSDKNAMDAIRNILRKDGVTGLYRGLWPNLLKVAPSIGTSFLVYETVQSAIHPHPKDHHHHGHHNGHNGHRDREEGDEETEKQ